MVKKECGGKKNITLHELLDVWLQSEELSNRLSNGTIMLYRYVASRISSEPIAHERLPDITSEMLQRYIDSLKRLAGTQKMRSDSYIRSHISVLNQAFEHAIFPMKILEINPMRHVCNLKKPAEEGIFPEFEEALPIITYPQLLMIVNYLEDRANPAALPIQISYYTGMRIGEVAALAWDDVDFKHKMIIVRRSMRYNSTFYRMELGTTKRAKVRSIFYGDALDEILKDAFERQKTARLLAGDSYKDNYYREISEGKRCYYEIISYNAHDTIPPDYTPINFVCTRKNGIYEAPSTIRAACHMISHKIPELSGFHFHELRHTYTTNLINMGASPKDVQELLGHSDISTTMNIYAHASDSSKREAAEMLDRITGIRS